jgi:hypothetical protein
MILTALILIYISQEMPVSTDMRGIYQNSLFSSLATISIDVPAGSRYRILSDNLPWIELATIANEHRAKTRDINNGAPLDLRLHLGAHIAQGMNDLTDRFTEDQIRYHAGVRILCGIADSTKTIDHTSVEAFRSSLGKDGVAELNKVIVNTAVGHGFTGGKLCSSDTTVQESPIAYPTEVGHLKNITEKLIGIGKKINKGIGKQVEIIGKKVKDLFTEIRLFTNGTKEKVVEKKKDLAKKLHRQVVRLKNMVIEAVSGLKEKSKSKYQEELESYDLMIEQIRQWMKTGYHPKGKLISLWNKTARAITRNKASKKVEFGVRWFITRLENGYIIGDTCKKIGSDADTKILEEVLPHFIETMSGEIPNIVVYDRGGDGKKNHDLIEDLKIKHNCIFLKGKKKMEVGSRIYQEAKRERALSEASIATIKHAKYGFNRPRAKSSEGCATKGQMAILGANLTKFVRDIQLNNGMNLEMI